MKNFTTRNKFLLGLFVVVAVVALSIFIDQGREMEEILDNTAVQPIPSQSPTVKKPVSTKSAQTAAQDYTNLVKEYEGRRIQFDINCQAIPNYVTYKNGIKIMLDNRSGDARIITVGGTQYSLAGYGYRLVTLSSTSLPKPILLSCGSAVNVGQILLQN